MLETVRDVKIFEDSEYSFEKLVRQKRICGFAVLAPYDSFRVVSDFVTQGTEFLADALSEADKTEILLHLTSFTDKLLLCEIGGKLCAFVPSVYPSSALCLTLIFDKQQFKTAQILRLIACDECPDIFVISDSISCKAARITDSLLADGESFFELCRLLRACFTDLGAPFEYAEKETYETLAKRLNVLSMLLGCPINSLRFSCFSKPSVLFDLPLLLAFASTFMLYAFNFSEMRTVDISLSDMSGELVAEISFECKNQTLDLPFVEWETIASDKNMFFEVHKELDCTCVRFQPIRRDWSYLGLKQNTEFIQ